MINHHTKMFSCHRWFSRNWCCTCSCSCVSIVHCTLSVEWELYSHGNTILIWQDGVILVFRGVGYITHYMYLHAPHHLFSLLTSKLKICVCLTRLCTRCVGSSDKQLRPVLSLFWPLMQLASISCVLLPNTWATLLAQERTLSSILTSPGSHCALLVSAVYLSFSLIWVAHRNLHMLRKLWGLLGVKLRTVELR